MEDVFLNQHAITVILAFQVSFLRGLENLKARRVTFCMEVLGAQYRHIKYLLSE